MSIIGKSRFPFHLTVTGFYDPTHFIGVPFHYPTSGLSSEDQDGDCLSTGFYRVKCGDLSG